MGNKNIILAGVLAIIMFCFFPSGVFRADTVIKNDREKVKGVVVEEYVDRVVISTTDGEKEILRSDIEKIDYDLEEQNLTRLGDQYQDKGMYQDAYHYYSQALKINPDYKSAKDGLDYSSNLMQQFSRKMKSDHVKRMELERDWRMGVSVAEDTMAEDLREVLGFSVEPDGAGFNVTDVSLASPAWKGGLRKGDSIVAVWGRLIGYTKPEVFMKRILLPEVREVKVTIIRGKEINVKNASGNAEATIGSRLGYSKTEGFEFLYVAPGGPADAAGIEKGDVVARIDGKSTRYMSLEELENLFVSKKGGPLDLGIKRELSIWKTFKEK